MVADGLSRRGHETRTVFIQRYSDAYDHVENADILVPTATDGLADKGRGVWALLAYLREHRPDAVITYDFWGNIFGSAGAKLAGVPVVIANQSLAPSRSGKLAVASFLDMVFGSLGLYSHNIVNSRWTEAQYSRYPHRYRRRLRYIEHGCLRPRIRLTQTTARERYGLPPNVELLVSVGRLSALKNQAALVAALPLLPHVHLALAGNGPARERIVRMAQDQGTSDRLHMVGEISRSDVFDFLAAADVFVFPSRSETFGLAAVEAAIAGLPVVANNLTVLREVLGDNPDEAAALFADTDDPHSLARCVSRLLCEPDLASRLRQNGEALARRYDPDRMAKAYSDLLTGMSEEPEAGLPVYDTMPSITSRDPTRLRV